MPRRRNAARAATVRNAKTRPKTRRNATSDDNIPDIYSEMLAEAYQDNPENFQLEDRSPKRRRVEEYHEAEKAQCEEVNQLEQPEQVQPASPSGSPTPVTAPIQTVFNDDFDESDSDSDAEFEDVDIDRPVSTESEDEEPKSIQIDLSAPTTTPRKAIQRRKPVTKAERDFRLDVHKWHLLCLLIHQATRNKWCDDETVQKRLKRLVPRKAISKLHREGTQAERKFAFDSAIEEICQIWKLAWKTTSRGIRRAFWREDLDIEKEVEEADEPIDLDDFREAAKECSGSRDLGAQLFCALLRSVAVDTRLVNSLQVLPFSRVAKGETPQKAGPSYIHAGTQDYGTGRRSTSTKKKKAIIDSPYPMWWVEAFNPAIDQWIPLDPLVRNTINKPRSSFEPPSSDNLNSMAYVIAFEDDGTAKDVTRRYVAAYNAKTRKSRIESTKHGQKWYSGIMEVFNKAPEIRDEIENAALDRRVAQEGMPKNVQDFKDHPVYVLERHLRSNEVIEPKKECGKLAVGKNQKVESVYRRENVYACRSADGWYRRGRDVKAGEQPLKRVAKRRGADPPPDDEEEEADEGVALYAEFQTDIYVPPPAVNGVVPRNGYGNLDVYVPSMIPAGAIHVRHPLALQAARSLKIDAAEAVIGFKFKGRQGTAIIEGVVVDAQYTAAMVATTTAVEDELEEEVNAQRSVVLDSVWKKMHTVLKVRQKLQEDYGGFDDEKSDDDEDDSTYEDDIGGGFVADAVGEATKESKVEEVANMNSLKDRQPVVLPPPLIRQSIVIVRSPHRVQALQNEDKDDLFDSDSEPGGFITENDRTGNVGDGGFMADEEEEGGGFLPDDDEDSGFLAEEGAKSFESDQDDKIVSAVPLDVEQPLTSNEEAGGFLPEELAKAAEPEEAPDPVRHRSPGEALQDLQRTLPSSQQNGNSISSTQASSISKLSKRKGKRAAGKPEANSNSDSESSMLSHDPEEDDAEMQWVGEAFDDDL